MPPYRVLRSRCTTNIQYTIRTVELTKNISPFLLWVSECRLYIKNIVFRKDEISSLSVSPNEQRPPDSLLFHSKLDPTTLLNGKKETPRPCRGITSEPTPTTHHPQPHYLHSSGPSITSPHLSPINTTFRPARQEQDFVLTSRESTDQHNDNDNNGQFSSSGDMHRDLSCRPPSSCSRTSLPHDSCLSQSLGHHGFQ